MSILEAACGDVEPWPVGSERGVRPRTSGCSRSLDHREMANVHVDGGRSLVRTLRPLLEERDPQVYGRFGHW